MWTLTKSTVADGYRFTVNDNVKVLSVGLTLELLRDDEKFRLLLITSLRKLPYKGYRWETPAYTKNTLDNQFEFVVLNAPTLDCRADPEPFSAYIGATDSPVVRFQTLGKDAHLVVPTPIDRDANYCHLASFTNSAQLRQQHELWRCVGHVGLELASNTPVWLSTAGGGVAWLHVRFDSRPKYYHYAEFKKSPIK